MLAFKLIDDIDEGFPIPPDVHATLVASLCRIQAALDQALTV